ncbi:hypothetical protein D3C84_1221260 [compost metagenome]
MGQIRYGLNCSLKGVSPQLIEHYREQDGYNETKHQTQTAHRQCVSQNKIEAFIVEEFFEVIQSDPLLLSKRFLRFIILECHQPSP